MADFVMFISLFQFSGEFKNSNLAVVFLCVFSNLDILLMQENNYQQYYRNLEQHKKTLFFFCII